MGKIKEFWNKETPVKVKPARAGLVGVVALGTLIGAFLGLNSYKNSDITDAENRAQKAEEENVDFSAQLDEAKSSYSDLQKKYQDLGNTKDNEVQKWKDSCNFMNELADSLTKRLNVCKGLNEDGTPRRTGGRRTTSNNNTTNNNTNNNNNNTNNNNNNTNNDNAGKYVSIIIERSGCCCQ
ncbi:MAG: hypothetical protein K5912_01845 [Alphaproteobacteria bacterium]|nr:hypothetical protein [Alphaproteobacteria bacterium]